VIDRLRHNPDDLFDEELRNLKLSNLSKALGPVSSRMIIDVYLRWLRIQSIGPVSNINSGWGSVLRSWAIALKGKGFSYREVADEIDHVKRFVGHRTRPLPNMKDFKYVWLHDDAANKPFAINK
jgi:hypothetical protein